MISNFHEKMDKDVYKRQVEYSLGKQGKKIWEAVELAANTEGIRGVIIYSSCMEVLTMWKTVSYTHLSQTLH